MHIGSVESELATTCRAVLAAARRRCRTMVRDDLPRIIAFHGPGRLTGAVLAAVGFVLGLWWLVRPVSPSVESMLPRVVSSVDAASTASTDHKVPPMVVSRQRVRVHVAGAVRRPGVYTLQGDARVVDAVRAAGGATTSADLDRINLAQSVLDAEQILVPRRGSVRTATTVAVRHRPQRRSTTTATTATMATTALMQPGHTLPVSGSPVAPPVEQRVAAKVNVNTATVDQLDSVPGVGPATARAIVSYRTRKGPFAKVDDLLNIDGIGPKKLATIKEYVEL